jgi:hypothetical protein
MRRASRADGRFITGFPSSTAMPSDAPGGTNAFLVRGERTPRLSDGRKAYQLNNSQSRRSANLAKRKIGT